MTLAGLNTTKLYRSMILTVEGSFDSAHYLYEYEGKCSSLHGHTWRVVLSFTSPKEDSTTCTNVISNVLNKLGIFVDFKVVKQIVKSVLDDLDHKCLINTSTKDGMEFRDYLRSKNHAVVELDVNPTAENLCFYITTKIKEKIASMGLDNLVVVAKIEVYETPTNKCEVTFV